VKQDELGGIAVITSQGGFADHHCLYARAVFGIPGQMQLGRLYIICTKYPCF